MFPDIKFPQTKIDWLIADFARKDKPTIADFMRLRTIGGLYDSLDNYRVQAKNMDPEQLESEQHKSDRLGRYMIRAGDPRPSSRCDAHAMISGGHRRSVVMRGIIAWLKMRIDDPHNGCWLPRDWEDRKFMPNYLRNAVPHKRIHTDRYYQWINGRIAPHTIKTPDHLVNALRVIRAMLQSGNVPPGVISVTGK